MQLNKMRLNTTYYGNIHYFCSYNKNITHLMTLEQIGVIEEKPTAGVKDKFTDKLFLIFAKLLCTCMNERKPIISHCKSPDMCESNVCEVLEINQLQTLKK